MHQRQLLANRLVVLGEHVMEFISFGKRLVLEHHFVCTFRIAVYAQDRLNLKRF